jgi:hypothetical protein
MASIQLPAVAGRVSPSGSNELEPHILISLPKAEPLSDHIQDQTQDRVCRELALECDRLDTILQSIVSKRVLKTGELVQTIARRISALKLLGERMDQIQDKEEISLEISVMAKVVRLTKDVLRESGLPAETRETLFQSLVEKISVQRDEGSR